MITRYHELLLGLGIGVLSQFVDKLWEHPPAQLYEILVVTAILLLALGTYGALAKHIAITKEVAEQEKTAAAKDQNARAAHRYLCLQIERCQNLIDNGQLLGLRRIENSEEYASWKSDLDAWLSEVQCFAQQFGHSFALQFGRYLAIVTPRHDDYNHDHSSGRTELGVRLDRLREWMARLKDEELHLNLAPAP